jgi:hypothetical protein
VRDPRLCRLSGRLPGRSLSRLPGRSLSRRRAALAAAAAATAALAGLTGCAKMDAALDKQWMIVDFNPTTSVATALHVRAACSHIQNAPPLPLPGKPSKLTPADVINGIAFNTTNASAANQTELTLCLQKFKSVQGVEPEDTGDEGS